MDYEDLPERVRDAVPAPPEDPDDDPGLWGLRHADPTDITPASCAACGDDLFFLPHEDGGCWHCGAEVCYVNDRGEQTHGEHVNDPGTPEIGYNLALDTDDDASGVMCGYCEESFGEGNTVVVVAPDGESFGATYEGTVIRDSSPYGEGKHSALYDAPEAIMDILRELVLGGRYVSTDAWRGYHTGPAEAASLEKVSSGWHSSMERSDLSERINGLTSGDLHRDVFRVNGEVFTTLRDATTAFEEEMATGGTVEAEPAALDVPVAVMFGRTSNVMSIGIDVYAPPEAHDAVESLLDARAEPALAGL